MTLFIIVSIDITTILTCLQLRYLNTNGIADKHVKTFRNYRQATETRLRDFHGTPNRNKRKRREHKWFMDTLPCLELVIPQITALLSNFYSDQTGAGAQIIGTQFIIITHLHTPNGFYSLPR